MGKIRVHIHTKDTAEWDKTDLRVLKDMLSLCNQLSPYAKTKIKPAIEEQIKIIERNK